MRTGGGVERRKVEPSSATFIFSGREAGVAHLYLYQKLCPWTFNNQLCLTQRYQSPEMGFISRPRGLKTMSETG